MYRICSLNVLCHLLTMCWYSKHFLTPYEHSEYVLGALQKRDMYSARSNKLYYFSACFSIRFASLSPTSHSLTVTSTLSLIDSHGLSLTLYLGVFKDLIPIWDGLICLAIRLWFSFLALRQGTFIYIIITLISGPAGPLLLPHAQ